MKSVLDRALESIARARAPKEPPMPAGESVAGNDALERPRCPGCKNTRARLVVMGDDTWIASASAERPRFSVVRCEVCGLRYTTPRYKFEHRRQAYAGEYPFYSRARDARPQEGAEVVWSASELDAARAPFLPRADHLQAAFPRPGRLLDLGAGDGLFLDVMRLRGWEVSGVDVEEDVVWHARHRLGLDTQVLDVEVEPLPEGPFDAITMWGVLQLLYEPRALLEHVRERLAPDGVIGIGVSNVRSSGAALFGPRWRGLGLPRHLTHFSPESLTRMVQWSGFEVLDVKYETPRWIVAGSVDAALPTAAPVRRAAKAVLYAAAQISGHTPYADTMELFARPARAT